LKIVATMPVRNEAWVLGLTLRAALMWCDEVIVLDHASADGTRDVITEVQRSFIGRAAPDRVVFVRWDDSAWDEMAQRQWMLMLARGRGATHIAILDADELVTGNLVSQMRGLVERTPANTILELPQINVRGSISTMHASGVWASCATAVTFQDSPACCWKADGHGYEHHHRAPYGIPERNICRPVSRGNGGLFHLQMLDEKRLRAKQLLYCLNDVRKLRAGIVGPAGNSPEAIRRYYSAAVYGDLLRCDQTDGRKPVGIFETAPVPASWWNPYTHLFPYLHASEEPWQLPESRRIVSEHPGILEGLDTFGLEMACSAS
jgi:hypothetical protein